MTFRIGASHAARVPLTAELIGADEALRLGLFHEIVANDLLWARCVEVARRCADSAPEALQLTNAEGMAAFLEKREPKWP